MFVDYMYCDLKNVNYEDSEIINQIKANFVVELNKRKLTCHPQGISIWQLMCRSHLLWMIYNEQLTPIGYFMGLVKRNTMIIYEFELFKEFQKQGYGTQILNKLKKTNKLIFVDCINEKTRLFFKKFGMIKNIPVNYK